MSREAKIKIGATTKVKGPISGVIAQLKKLGKVSKKVNAGIKASIRGIGSVFRATQRVGVLAVAALGAIGIAVKTAFDFELAQKQFEVLLGSVEKAKARFQELKELSAGTPFELKNLIEASKTLEGFGLKGDKNVKALRMIGDAAAALDPQKLEEMALAFGRLFTGASVGLTGEPTMRLLELKVLAPKTKIEIDRLSKSAGNFDKVMDMARADMMRFTGGMAQLSTTGHGLFSTLKDNWTISLAAFGDEFMDLSKNTMRSFIQKLTDLRNNGSIKAWAESAVKSLSTVKSLLADIFSGDPALRSKAFEDIGNVIKFAFMDAATAAGNMLKDAAPTIGGMIYEGFKREMERSVFGDPVAPKGAGRADVEGRGIKGGRIVGPILPPPGGGAEGSNSKLGGFLKGMSKRRQGEEGSVKPSVKRRIEDDRTRFTRLADERKAAKAKVQMEKFGMARFAKETTSFLFGKKKESRKFQPEMLGRGVTRRAESPRDGESEGANVGGLVRRQLKGIQRGKLLLNAGIRLEKKEAEIEKGIEERRGIGLGELFDMKQFGMTKTTGELGEANNPMHVVLDEAPV
tara:strand:+ start:60 stop:1781 length:1722 start_codon:yes stop_codon:yes gene_type:complete